MGQLWQLFFIFLKINLLSPSGPASLGVLHEETVPRFITDAQFVEAASFSRFLPGLGCAAVGRLCALWRCRRVWTCAAGDSAANHHHARHFRDPTKAAW